MVSRFLQVKHLFFFSISKQNNFKEKMFEKWRPKRPYDSLVESLKRGLERIDKHAEADFVQEAFVNVNHPVSSISQKLLKGQTTEKYCEQHNYNN
jgi:hypothetical protein